MEIGKTENYLLKTKPPVSLVILGVVFVFVTIRSFSHPEWLIYLAIFTVIFYVQFCRYACIVFVSTDFIKVQYFAPWLKNVCLKTSAIERLDYEKGFYDFFSRKKIGANLFLPQYCYDRLILFFNNPSATVVYLNINTFMFDFKKIFDVLS